ncbi:hypothetical protein T439DRAFT_321749 [Meredithblackwellia eburnea MCA 4105]
MAASAASSAPVNAFADTTSPSRTRIAVEVEPPTPTAATMTGNSANKRTLGPASSSALFNEYCLPQSQQSQSQSQSQQSPSSSQGSSSQPSQPNHSDEPTSSQVEMLTSPGTVKAIWNEYSSTSSQPDSQPNTFSQKLIDDDNDEDQEARNRLLLEQEMMAHDWQSNPAPIHHSDSANNLLNLHHDSAPRLPVSLSNLTHPYPSEPASHQFNLPQQHFTSNNNHNTSWNSNNQASSQYPPSSQQAGASNSISEAAAIHQGLRLRPARVVKLDRPNSFGQPLEQQSSFSSIASSHSHSSGGAGHSPPARPARPPSLPAGVPSLDDDDYEEDDVDAEGEEVDMDHSISHHQHQHHQQQHDSTSAPSGSAAQVIPLPTSTAPHDANNHKTTVSHSKVEGDDLLDDDADADGDGDQDSGDDYAPAPPPKKSRGSGAGGRVTAARKRGGAGAGGATRRRAAAPSKTAAAAAAALLAGVAAAPSTSSSPFPPPSTLHKPAASASPSASASPDPTSSTTNSRRRSQPQQAPLSSQVPPARQPLGEDEPIQARRYLTDSTTSRKVMPKAIAKVARARGIKVDDILAASGVQADGSAIHTTGHGSHHPSSVTPVDDIDSKNNAPATPDGTPRGGEPELPSEIASFVDQRRAMNTLAARRSRAQKRAHLESLEQKVKDQEQELEALRSEVESLRKRVRIDGRLESVVLSSMGSSFFLLACLGMDLQGFSGFPFVSFIIMPFSVFVFTLNLFDVTRSAIALLS